MKKISLFYFLTLCLALNAQEVIDQQQTSFTNSNIYLLAFDEPGQSFISGYSSTITKIEVFMDCGSTFGCSSQISRLNFYNANVDNTPNGTALASNIANTSFSGADSNPVWAIFNFPANTSVIQNNKYVFTLSGVSGSSDFGVYISGTDTYANGAPIRRNAGSTGAWSAQTGKDITFKVYVINNLGLEELAYKKDFISYVSNKKLAIKSLSNQDFVIFDTNGKEIKKFNVTTDIVNYIDIENLGKGVYVLSNNSASTKFIVE